MRERRNEIYSNMTETDLYLDDAKPTYIGNFSEMYNMRDYPFWDSLAEEALRTGKPQNEIKDGENLFTAIYGNPERLRLFLRSMTGHSPPLAMATTRKLPWQKSKSFIDIGTAEGCLPVQGALANSHLRGEGFGLPSVRPVFEEYVAAFGLQDRSLFRNGDFFKDPLPSADALVMA